MLLDQVLCVLSAPLEAAAEAGEVNTASWTRRSDTAALMTVLKHHSPRVQWRAIRLVQLLLPIDGFTHEALVGGLAGALLHLLTHSSSGLVKLQAMCTMLLLLGQPDAAAAQELLLRHGLVNLALQLLLSPETGKARPNPTPELPTDGSIRTSGEIKGLDSVRDSVRDSVGSVSNVSSAPEVATPPTPAVDTADEVDFARPGPCNASDLQLAASQLLALLCRGSPTAAAQLAELGGVSLLLLLLPPPHTPSSAAPPPAITPSAIAEEASPDPGVGGRAGLVTSPSSPAPESQQAPTPEEPTGVMTLPEGCLEDPWVRVLLSHCPFEPPEAPAQSHQVQALLLSALSSMLAIPGLRNAAAILHERLQLPLMLCYLLSSPLPTRVCPSPLIAESSEGAVAAAGAAKSSKAKDKGSKAAAAAAATAAVAAATEKARLKLEAEQIPPHLAAPFPLPVRCGALACLHQLALHPTYAQSLLDNPDIRSTCLIAAQPVTISANASPRAPPDSASPPRSSITVPPVGAHGGGGSSSEEITAVAGLVQLLMQAAKHTNKALSQSASSPSPSSTIASAARSSLTGKPGSMSGGASAPVSARTGPSEWCRSGGLSQDDAVTILKQLAVAALATGDKVAISAVARALMVLPEEALLASPRPPLPSPPRTPPPPPLATSQFVWDALGRPVMSDGLTHSHS
ncbi:MAG: hypothetical protein WDW38_005555 [Sanguina aurantia]